MSHITTWSGKRFDPAKPETAKILMADIAHSLSLLCRGNGHVRVFYSVAQHCLACEAEAQARALPPRVRLACLLHDAAEAYLSDMPRPVKELFPEYTAIEDRLLSAVLGKYMGQLPTEDEWAEVRAIDDDMLAAEFHALMAEDLTDRTPRLLAPVSFSYVHSRVNAAKFEEKAGELIRLVRCAKPEGSRQ